MTVRPMEVVSRSNGKASVVSVPLPDKEAMRQNTTDCVILTVEKIPSTRVLDDVDQVAESEVKRLLSGQNVPTHESPVNSRIIN
jgi:hypothetical protein